MFRDTCYKNRDSIYGVWVYTLISNDQQINAAGTGFTIAPGILVTCAHVIHHDGDTKKPIHTGFNIIRSPDIGQCAEKATFIAEDTKRDIAILKITSPRSNKYLTLEPNKMPSGTSCGSLGFPFCNIVDTPQGPVFNLVERFQGYYISSYVREIDPSQGIDSDFYETDTLMYGGSSGCPVFISDSNAIGMQSRYRNNVQGAQLAISMLVPSMEIIKFARDNGIDL